MKTAIMYGAGKIGRGFIGKIFSDSGYEVCFFDILQDLVDALNARGEYPVRRVSNTQRVDVTVKPVRAVHSLTEAAIDEIARCDIMATAVGVNELCNIAPVIARGMVRRMETSGRPLNVILCENQIGADAMMRDFIYPHLTNAQRAWAEGHLGLVGAAIGPMVPPVTPELLAEDRLLICMEPYSELPVDRDAIRGDVPDLKGLIPYSPFEFYIKRKLFIHNGGHALCAYLGYEKGYPYIWQAMADAEICDAVRASMLTSARALANRFGPDRLAGLEAHVAELMERLQNKALMDTVARVGADPVRKLRRNDRIVGAALFALEQSVDPAPIVRGIVAALRFDQPGDPTAPLLQAALKENGVDHVMQRYMGLRPEEPLYAIVKEALQ